MRGGFCGARGGVLRGAEAVSQVLQELCGGALPYLSARPAYGSLMTKKQPFEIERTFDDFELRRYPDHVLVQVTVPGDFQRAGNLGFRPLFNYISGGNAAATRIPMTTPVTQEPLSPRSQTVSFVLPEGTDPATVPVPTDATVSTLAVPAGTVAARRFGGGLTDDRFEKNGIALLAAVERAGLRPAGNLYFARYDPPWKPGFLKHNEALVRV